MIPLLIITFFVSMLIGIPIAFVLGITSLSAVIYRGYPMLTMVQRVFSGLDSFPLMAIPFFILAGNLMNTGGITRRLVRFSHYLVGHIKGGLAHTNIVVSMLFAGITGAAVADTSAIGSILIPAMVEDGYDVDFSAAVTVASSTVGPIIPPSILMVIYGVTTGTSIGGLFLAGFIPGLFIGLSLMVVSYYYAVKRDYPRVEKRVSFKEFMVAFKDAIIPLMAPVIIIGGILSGVFTATEASSIAVLYAFIISFFVYNEITWKDLPDLLMESAITTGIILLVIGTANALAWIISIEQINQAIANTFLSITDNSLVFFLLVNILLLLVGTIMEPGAAIIILAPVLAPLATRLGIHHLHFGFIMVLNLVIGLATPPLGLCLFVACGISKVKLKELSVAVFPFVLVIILVLLIMTYIPAIPMFIPKLLGYY